MILDFLFQIFRWFVELLNFLAPDYADFPLPDGFLDSAGQLFVWMKTFLQLPLIRVFSEFVTDFIIPLAFALVIYWLIKRVINFIRGTAEI